MDPFQHPDLERLGMRLQQQLDEVLEAEQYAAYISARRRRTMRDQLIEWEDREQRVVAITASNRYRGCLDAVGADYVVVALDGGTVAIPLDQLVAVET